MPGRRDESRRGKLRACATKVSRMYLDYAVHYVPGTGPEGPETAAGLGQTTAQPSATGYELHRSSYDALSRSRSLARAARLTREGAACRTPTSLTAGICLRRERFRCGRFKPNGRGSRQNDRRALRNCLTNPVLHEASRGARRGKLRGLRHNNFPTECPWAERPTQGDEKGGFWVGSMAQ